MAETTAVIVTKTQHPQDSKNPPQNNNNGDNNIVLSLLRNLDLKIKQLPFFNRGQKKPGGSVSVVVVDKEEPMAIVEKKKPSDVVKFSDPRPNITPPLELEAEQPAGRTSNPVVLWQVYAITGFMVLRWVWARWNERKERSAKKDASDDDDDDDDHQSPTNEDRSDSG